jgi:hypothetical protein
MDLHVTIYLKAILKVEEKKNRKAQIKVDGRWTE